MIILVFSGYHQFITSDHLHYYLECSSSLVLIRIIIKVNHPHYLTTLSSLPRFIIAVITMIFRNYRGQHLRRNYCIWNYIYHDHFVITVTVLTGSYRIPWRMGKWTFLPGQVLWQVDDSLLRWRWKAERVSQNVLV